MPKESTPELDAAIMAAERRSWAVQIGHESDAASETLAPVGVVQQAESRGDTMDKPNGQKRYWEAMTPEQRSAEISRRHRVAAANRVAKGLPAKRSTNKRECLAVTTIPVTVKPENCRCDLSDQALTELRRKRDELAINLAAIDRVLEML